jgi:DnaK suppressor protein
LENTIMKRQMLVTRSVPLPADVIACAHRALTAIVATAPKREGIQVEGDRGDAFDRARHGHDSEVSAGTLAVTSLRLIQARTALDRIADGTFGVCLHCEADMTVARIAAVPEAPLCKECKEDAEAGAMVRNAPHAFAGQEHYLATRVH